MGEVVAEELAEAESPEEVLQDGQRGDPPRVEGASVPLGAGRLSGLSRLVHAGDLRRSRGERTGSVARPHRLE
jgi:hypothetical protein